MKVEIWFDFVCPFCYLGDTKFEKALSQFEHKDEVELVFRSFRLNMEYKSTEGKDIHQIIADKYHISYAEAKENNDNIAKAGREVGLNYNFDDMKLGDTEFAHQIMQYAKKHRKDHDLIMRYFKAYFEEGLYISDREILLQIAGDTGLDLSELSRELVGGSLKAEMLKDEAAARRLGINGVPHFIFDGKYSISGAQDPKYFLAAMNKIYAENNSK